jgi:hypothetical protein
VAVVQPNTGTIYISGNITGSDNLGCGTIAGSGVWFGAIDTTGACVWSKAAGASANIINAGAYDYLVGSFTGTLDVGCGPMTSAASTSYAAKLDATGACVWSRALPVPSLGLKVMPANQALITGSISGTADVGCGPVTGSGAIVAKLDAAGACAWSRAFTGSFTIVPFSTGDLAVSTTITTSFDFGCGAMTAAGTQDLAIGRLAGATGACVWSKRFGAAGASVGGNVSVSALDYPITLGTVSGGAVDFGGGPISGTGYVLELDGSGAYRYQYGAAYERWSLDTSGDVHLAQTCATCASGSPGVTVTKLAP